MDGKTNTAYMLTVSYLNPQEKILEGILFRRSKRDAYLMINTVNENLAFLGYKVTGHHMDTVNLKEITTTAFDRMVGSVIGHN